MVTFWPDPVKVTKVMRDDVQVTRKTRGHGHYRQAAFLWKLGSGNRKLSTVHKLVYLSLGSNVGDRASNLWAAIDHLNSLGEVVAVSSFYETEPVEFTAQPWFLNCAVRLNTEKMPRQLFRGIMEIEKKMGRRRVQKKGPRIIDIDILLFGNSIIATQGLTIP